MKYILQVASGAFPRFLSHFEMTDTGLTPVITALKQDAILMSQQEAQSQLSKLQAKWRNAQIVELN
ncbi:hypothetical protein ACK3Q8_003836 [Vibrio parahaemolyticus]